MDNNFINITRKDIQINLPKPDSHKGQNGRLLIIGGSKLFHAASLWSLQVASRIVDLVHYSSVEENNELVVRLKEEFRNGIVVSRSEVEAYIEEDDCILIGPGMVRSEALQATRDKQQETSLDKILEIQDEGKMTGVLTNYLLSKYPQKQWVIDAGALQMVDISLIPHNAILTPHQGEFERLEKNCYMASMLNCYPSEKSVKERTKELAKSLNCIILLKGQIDIACSPEKCSLIEGGNSGMTKGGTGDVLAGLIAALACANDPYQATIAGSYINKTAGDDLYKSVGTFFNASDMADQIPKIMKRLLIDQK